MHDFDRLAPIYDKALSILLIPFGGRKRFRASLIRFFLHAARMPDEAKIADIGCGTGDFIPYMPDSFEIHCYDSSASMLQQAKSKFVRYGHKNFKIIQLPVEQITSSHQFYDAVIMSLFLHELQPDLLRKALRLAPAILKPGGYLFVADFTKPHNILSSILFSFIRLIEPPQAVENITNLLPKELKNLDLEFISSRHFLGGLIEALIFRKSPKQL